MNRPMTIRVALLTAGACMVWWTRPSPAQTPQEHVHSSAHTAMPFDISKTVHIFSMTEQGGIQRVVIRDASAQEQVAPIQQHLRQEAERFQKGDYSDPGMLHGKDMPGLRDLQSAGSKIKVSYAALSDGAEIVFSTEDKHLLTSIHRWFGAQLSEHGADAKAE
jgi:hypothetical protein